MGFIKELSIVGAIFIVVYLLHHSLPLGNKLIEGMSSRASKTGMCGDNTCPKGCEEPTSTSGNCTSTYKDEEGGFYKKCPYDCPDTFEPCRYDDCCVGCGHVKFNVDKDGKVIGGGGKKVPGGKVVPASQKPSGGKSQHGHSHATHPADIPEPHNPTHPPTSASIPKLPPQQPTPVNQSYQQLSNGSEYTRQYPCTASVTGVFTDCGAPPANMGCFANQV